MGKGEGRTRKEENAGPTLSPEEVIKQIKHLKKCLKERHKQMKELDKQIEESNKQIERLKEEGKNARASLIKPLKEVIKHSLLTPESNVIRNTQASSQSSEIHEHYNYKLGFCNVTTQIMSDSEFYKFLLAGEKVKEYYEELLKVELYIDTFKKFERALPPLLPKDSEFRIGMDVANNVYYNGAICGLFFAYEKKFKANILVESTDDDHVSFSGKKNYGKNFGQKIDVLYKNGKKLSEHLALYETDSSLPGFDVQYPKTRVTRSKSLTTRKTNGLQYLDNLVKWSQVDGYDHDDQCMIERAFHYMCDFGLRYTVICSYERWSFLMFHNGRLYVAGQYSGRKGVQFTLEDGKEVYLWELLIRWILRTTESELKAEEEVPGFKDYLYVKKKNESKNQKKKRKSKTMGEEEEEEYDDNDDDWNDGNTEANEHRKYWTGQITVGMLRFGVQPELLGDWRTGYVWRKKILNRDMVVKQSCWEEDGGMRKLVRTELLAYDALSKLQSRVIPKMFYAGIMLDGWTDCVATSYEGVSLSDYDGKIDKTFISKAMKGLDEIHELGVLHGDVALRNILIRQNDGSPIWIDFGYSKFDPTKEEKQKERKEAFAELSKFLQKTSVEEVESKFADTCLEINELESKVQSSEPSDKENRLMKLLSKPIKEGKNHSQTTNCKRRKIHDKNTRT